MASLGPAAGNQLPVAAGFEKRFDTVGGAPIEVALRIAAISKRRWNRNNALMLIVGQGDKYVNDSW
jgi:hypothetical protein